MPKLPGDRARRRAFTLIELIVVISILAVLMTLTVVFVIPAFQDNKNVIRGVDRVSTTLLISKQRALRDAAPRGVRFLVDPNNAAALWVNRLQYIEQPEPFTGGQVTVAPGSTTVTMFNVDLLGGATVGSVDQYNVQPGDYFRYESGGVGSNFQIAAVDPASNTLTLNNPVNVPIPPMTSSYKIVRQPRPIAGEAEVNLPQNVVVDLNQVNASGPNNQVPTRSVPGGTVTYYEILFDPAGGVTNRPSSTPIALIVRDSTADNALDANTTRVMGINPRTGFISAHPVGPAGNPLQFALDGKSSGL